MGFKQTLQAAILAGESMDFIWEETVADAPNAIAIAAQLGCIDAVDLLIMYGGNVNATHDRHTALEYAAANVHQGEYMQIALTLLDHPDLDVECIAFGQAFLQVCSNTNGGKNQEILARAMVEMSKGGDDDVLSSLLSFSSYGITALHGALFAKNVGVIRFLLEAGADPNEPKHDEFGDTPLCMTSDIAVAELLLEYGADVNQFTGWNELHVSEQRRIETPLHAAARDGSTDLVAVFLNNDALILHDKKFGLTALDEAFHRGDRHGQGDSRFVCASLICMARPLVLQDGMSVPLLDFLRASWGTESMSLLTWSNDRLKRMFALLWQVMREGQHIWTYVNARIVDERAAFAAMCYNETDETMNLGPKYPGYPILLQGMSWADPVRELILQALVAPNAVERALLRDVRNALVPYCDPDIEPACKRLAE